MPYFSAHSPRSAPFMKCLFLPLYLALLTTLLQPPVAVQAQAGTVIKTFSLNAKKLLLDPVRPQLYATLPTENSVAVINTDTNAVVATLPTGSIPADLAISPDGTRLYVANTGSTSAGVSVVDLTTLTVLPSLATPFTPGAVAAGLDNRIYVLLGGSEVFGVSGIAQIDVTSGAAANPFPTQYSYQNGSLAMSPNHSILYVGNGGILSFDVSTATPAVLQQNEVGGFGDIIISHDGQYLFAPGSEANSSPDDVSSLISTVNLNAIPRTIASGYYPGPAAFSADGAEIYQAQYLGANPRSSLNVFSTATSALLNSFTLLTPSDYAGNPATATSVAVTSPNGYLYVASSTDPYGDNPTSLRAHQHAGGPLLQRFGRPLRRLLLPPVPRRQPLWLLQPQHQPLPLPQRSGLRVPHRRRRRQRRHLPLRLHQPDLLLHQRHPVPLSLRLHPQLLPLLLSQHEDRWPLHRLSPLLLRFQRRPDHHEMTSNL